jgi:conjugal transfer ATP-binding protein TraC
MLPKNITDLISKIASLLGDKINLRLAQKIPPCEELNQFFEQYPLSSLMPYESYDPETNLFINKGSVGFMLEATPLTGASEETVNILSSILTDVLPDNSDLQFLFWASNKIGAVFDQFKEKRSERGEIFSWLADKRIDFLRAGVKESLINSGNYLLRDFQLFIIVSVPKKSGENFGDELLKIRDDIVSSLKSINIFAKNIAIERFLSILIDLINPSWEIYPAKQTWNELDALGLQITDPETHLVVYPNKMVLENENEKFELRCFTVRDFPEKMAQWKVTDNIGQLFNSSLQIPCPFIISFHIRIEDHEKSSSRAQLKFMSKDQAAKSPLARFRPMLTKEHEDWAFVRDRLAEGDRLVKTFYQVIIYTTSDQGNAMERKVRDLYRANGWKLRKESFLQLQSWLAMLPMMFSEGMYQDLKLFGRLRTMTAFNAVNIAPLQGEWKGTRSPNLLLPGRRGQVALWSPFDNPEGNYNVAIAAKSGSGKSVFTQEYIVSLVGSGGRVWVIDVGRSYEKTCRMLDGEFIEFKPETIISLNPFTYIKNFDESIVMLKPLLAAMARSNTKASEEEVSFLEKALKAAWQQEGNQASVTTVADWLLAQNDQICKNLGHLLYSYTDEGMYGKYFSGKSTIHIDNPFVVLELQELKAKKDLQKIVLLVLMYQISEAMYLGDRRQTKSCIIDEAWDLLGGDNDGAAAFIEAGYRTARRYNANFVTITQSINDYFKNATSKAAFENSDNNIILGQKPETIEDLKKNGKLEMDGYTERLFKSLRKADDFSECIIKGASGLSVHRIILDPYSRILYSSKGQEFEEVNQLKQQGKSLREAIAIVAERKFV